MKYFLLLAACVLVFTGCQPQPVIVNNTTPSHDHHCPPTVIRERRPIVIEQRPPVVVKGCNFYHHCGCFSCPVCRANNWYRCSAHDHCGGCPHCRANGWVGFGIHIGNGHIGIGVHPHHH